MQEATKKKLDEMKIKRRKAGQREGNVQNEAEEKHMMLHSRLRRRKSKPSGGASWQGRALLSGRLEKHLLQRPTVVAPP